jgi:hypothetical protein
METNTLAWFASPPVTKEKKSFVTSTPGVETVPVTRSVTPAASTPDFTGSTDPSTFAVTSSGSGRGSRKLRLKLKSRIFLRGRTIRKYWNRKF